MGGRIGALVGAVGERCVELGSWEEDSGSLSRLFRPEFGLESVEEARDDSLRTVPKIVREDKPCLSSFFYVE
jgi:hypothetical protein